MMRLKIGSIVTFSYASRRSHDRFPKILVLHPGWRTPGTSGDLLVHALNLNLLTDDETNLLRMLIDPGFQLKYFENLVKKNPQVATQYNVIISSAANANITSPHDFYIRVIKPFIRLRSTDPYRLYKPALMINGKVLQTQRQMLGDQDIQFFGSNPANHGKDEKQILKDLALKKVAPQRAESPLTPQEQKFIRSLRGRSLQLFQSYKTKFQHMKGPQAITRGTNTRGNQPSWMTNQVDDE